MQKVKTQEWKNKSVRNRHTGRINAATQWVLDKGQRFAMSDGKEYSTFVTKVLLPAGPNDRFVTDEYGVIGPEKKFLIKTQTVRVRS